MHFAATGRLLEDQGVQASLPRTVSDELPGVGSLGPWAAQPRSVTLLRALHGGPASARVNQPRGKGLSGHFPCSRGQVARLEWRGWNSTAPADGFPSGRSRLPLAKLRPGPRVPRPSLRRKSSPGRTGHSVGACGGHVCVPANPRAPQFWGTPLPAPQALCRACPLRLPLTTWPSPSELALAPDLTLSQAAHPVLLRVTGMACVLAVTQKNVPRTCP